MTLFDTSLKSVYLLSGLVVCLLLWVAACGPRPSPPVGTLSYSINPAPAGELIITATFDEPLAAAPTISALRPGETQAATGPMQGAGQVWNFAYSVQPAGGLSLLDQPATVTVTGIANQDGTQAEPLVDQSLLIYAPEPEAARTSLGRLFFIKRNEPIFTAGEPGAWDSGAVGASDVIKVGDQYWMYYSGFDDDGNSGGIGLAFSSDRQTWERQPDPVISPGADGEWDSGVAVHPTVVWDGSLYHMWYIGQPEGGDGYTFQFGHTTSRDGLNWARAQPVLAPGPAGEWDEERIGGLDVELLNGEFHMMYAATTLTPEFERQIGCALSRDGVSWTKCDSNPLFSPDPVEAPFEGNEVEEPELTYFYGTWLMGYSGYGGYQGSNFHLGVAYSTDGIEWQRLFKSPAVQWGGEDSFDEIGAGQPSIMVEGNKLWLWYTGYSEETSAIGLAVATLD